MGFTAEKITARNSKTNRSFLLKKDRSKPCFFQPKLNIGPANDAYEKEADEVADRVMRMSGNQLIQSKISSVDIHRKCAECEEEEQLQRKCAAENRDVTEVPSIVTDAINSGGRSLDDSTKSFMQDRFGYDFSAVKVHMLHKVG